MPEEKRKGPEEEEEDTGQPYRTRKCERCGYLMTARGCMLRCPNCGHIVDCTEP